MKKIRSEFLNEEYFYEKLDNGLEVYLYPKNEFIRTTALLNVNYGSLDTDFYIGDNLISTPKGVAHFLEHKMFCMENVKDVTEIFASFGADVNAYTSYENTCYYFNSVKNFKNCLELLLDFVQTPYFNEAEVEKERGIIAQELLTGLDDPTNCCYHGMLNLLYKENNIKDEIGGTIDSIQEITADTLYDCYYTFYHPANMRLIVVGNMDVEETLSLIKENQAKKTFSEFSNPKVIRNIEGNDPEIKSEVKEMDVHTNFCYLSGKIDVSEKSYKEISRLCNGIECFLEYLFGNASSTYQQLIKEEVIDYSFAYEFSIGKKYGYVAFYDETLEPAKFYEGIRKIYSTIKDITIPVEYFNHFKKLLYSGSVRSFNSINSICGRINTCKIDGVEIFEDIDMLRDLDYEVLEDVKKYFREEVLVEYTISPQSSDME